MKCHCLLFQCNVGFTFLDLKFTFLKRAFWTSDRGGGSRQKNNYNELILAVHLNRYSLEPSLILLQILLFVPLTFRRREEKYTFAESDWNQNWQKNKVCKNSNWHFPSEMSPHKHLAKENLKIKCKREIINESYLINEIEHH